MRAHSRTGTSSGAHKHASHCLTHSAHARGRRTLTLTGGALGRQRVSGGALTRVAPLRVGAGTSPAQQRVPHTLVHVCACVRESRWEDADRGGGGVARGSFSLQPPVPSPRLCPGALEAQMSQRSRVGAERSRDKSGRRLEFPGESGPRVTEGAPEKPPCRAQWEGEGQCPGISVGSRLSHPAPQAPVSCTSFHPSGPPQGLCTCCSPFGLIFQPLFTTFSPTLSATPQAPQNRTSLRTTLHLTTWPSQALLTVAVLHVSNISFPIRS